MKYVLLFLALGAVAATSHAQTKTGTTIGQVLLIEPSARAAAMGGTGVAWFGDAQALYGNPAAPAQLLQPSAQFTYMDYYAGVTYQHAVASVPFGVNAFSFSLGMLDSGEMDVRTEDQPQGTGERFRYTTLALGVGLSRKLTDRFSGGVTVHYLRESIWNSYLTAVSVNAGVLYRTPFGADLGASLSNFGTRGQYDGINLRIRYDRDPTKYGDNPNLPGSLYTESFALPILFRVGMAWPVELGSAGTLTVATEAFQPSDNTSAMSVGAEWRYGEVLKLRGGYDRLFQDESTRNVTLGGGIGWRRGTSRLTADYAWNPHARLGAIQRFTVGLVF